MTKLNTEDKATIVRNIVNDNDTHASFDYVDRQGNESHRLVRLDSFKADERGNWTFYCYANGVGNGGGIRSFKGTRISNFKIVD